MEPGAVQPHKDVGHRVSVLPDAVPLADSPNWSPPFIRWGDNTGDTAGTVPLLGTTLFPQILLLADDFHSGVWFLASHG